MSDVIREALLQEHSKCQTVAIAQYIGKDKLRFEQLLNLIQANEPLVAQRAGWVLTECALNHLELAVQYQQVLLKLLDLDAHVSVRRSALKVLSLMPIEEDLQGQLVDKCFALLSSPSETVAVKGSAMLIIATISRELPELFQELKLHIEAQLPYQSAGFISRAKQILSSKGKS